MTRSPSTRRMIPLIFGAVPSAAGDWPAAQLATSDMILLGITKNFLGHRLMIYRFLKATFFLWMKFLFMII